MGIIELWWHTKTTNEVPDSEIYGRVLYIFLQLLHLYLSSLINVSAERLNYFATETIQTILSLD